MTNKKELLEYPGSFAGNAGSNFSIGKNLGHTGADASYSSYISNKKVPVDYFEEDEEDVEEEILEKRIKGDHGYSLIKTLENVNEDYDYLDKTANMLKYGGRALASGTKAVALSIPILDAVAGSIYLTSGVLKFRKITNDVISYLEVEENSFAEAISADDEQKWQEIVQKVSMVSIEDRADMNNSFNDLLFNIKAFLVTLVQAYDSIAVAPAAVAAGTVSAGTGAVATEASSNIITSLGGFLVEMVPAERLVFDLIRNYSSAMEKLFAMVFKSDPRKIESMEEKGGPVFMALLYNPARTMRRLGDFYNSVSSEAPPLTQLATGAVDRVASGDIPDFDSFRRELAEAYKKSDIQAFNEQSLTMFIVEDSSNENVRLRMRGVGDPEGYASGIFEKYTDDWVHYSGGSRDKTPPFDHTSTMSDVEFGKPLPGQKMPLDTSEAIEEKDDDIIDEEVDEQAGAGGVAGVGMKLGHNSDGSKTSKSQLKDLRRKQDIYRITENQTWSHKTLGRIKYK